MREYKYKKVKGYEVKKFTENGHTMFEADVLKRLERLSYLEEQIKQGRLLPVSSNRFSGGVLFCDRIKHIKINK